VKLSIALTNYSWPGDATAIAGHVLDLAKRVDAGGLDTLWVADHLLQMDPNADVDEPMLEAYTTLGYAAAVTTDVRLGTMVTWATIRPPALLLKTVSTLDVLSNGRAWLGLGAGYQADEARRMGLPFEPTAERFSRLEELLQLAGQMWEGDRRAFHGPHNHLDEPIASPPPIARPRVLIGGMGERRTLPLVARYADACNLFDVPDGGVTVQRKIDVLAKACEAVGRSPDEIEVTLSSRIGGDNVSQFTERCAEWRERGVDHLVLVTTGAWQPGGELDVALESVDPLRRLG
jgi:alkanesulfonate monooxygenase SsuD/methylene tetrahydromethanopterin reductase-like flavin-dependent oxidoreductase (luciferase family)